MKRALISVSDKKGIVEFVKALTHHDFEIISSEGTAKTLKDAGISVRTVSEITGFPEILGGRVKTLHPKIHGGILCENEYRKSVESNSSTEEQNILPFDLVVCNFYPFSELPITKSKISGTQQPNLQQENNQSPNFVETIDIGGPAMVRAAAKNFENVAVVTSPIQYGSVLKELESNGGSFSDAFRFSLAREAFELTHNYDAAIAQSFSNMQTKEPTESFPQKLNLSYDKVTELRYGENSHQRAALYRDSELGSAPGYLPGAEQIQGKTLSFTNLLDFEAALGILREFDSPTAVIIKHTNPCGVGRGINIIDAYRLAHLADPLSAFGGIVGLNDKCDEETAKEIVSTFIEGVIAPQYSEESLSIFGGKKNLRVLKLDVENPGTLNRNRELRSIRGGILLQESDIEREDSLQWEIATRREPSKNEKTALEFAWKIVKHIKSNGIVIAIQNRTIGIGAGQMSRIDSVELALRKARGMGSFTLGTIMASDGFFPFRDSIDIAAGEGVTAVVQPGGSIRDKEVIQACIEHDITMLFTKTRHFKH
jgi:phosphoribosylaminoimidazolecarboxamide formyltransferase/IMP cyclohydrolase